MVEEYPGASLEDRTAILSQINDLGPPDLVNLTKIIGTPNKSSTPASLQTTGTYLYYTGADTSNVATIAALVNSLAMIISQEPQIWFGKPRPFHVSHATYSTYNAFRKLDLRVKVAFPGSVSWEVLDAFGNHATAEMVPENEVDVMWQECFISSVVRSLVTSDDDGDFSSIVEIRRINPFLNPSLSIPEFLQGFLKLYPEGEKLGCNEDVQVPTRLNNYLVDALYKCIELTHCYDEALQVLYKLNESYPEVSAIIAKVLFLSNRELEAIRYIHETLSSSKNVSEIPGGAQLLLIQSQFCLNKSRPDLALPLAVKAVESSPSIFEPWAHLVKVYISMSRFEDALLTLNTCPMVTHKDKYILKRIALGAAKRAHNSNSEDSSPSSPSSPSNASISPSSSSMHLPLPQDVFLRGVTDLNSLDVANEHSKLANQNSNKRRNSTENNGSLTPQNLLTLPAASLKSTFRKAYSLLAEIVRKLGWEGMLNMRSKVFVMEEEWCSNPQLGSSSDVRSKKIESTAELHGEIRTKRLCERWLDNLFMLLFEDMKVYTLCRAQEMQAESMSDSLPGADVNVSSGSNKVSVSENLGLWGGARSDSNGGASRSGANSGAVSKPKVDPYTESRSCLEWELLGLVCERLGHTRDAQRCYERALARRFSVRAAKKLIGIYGAWRDRARTQIGIQGKLQYSALLNSTNTHLATSGLIAQSKWNASTMSFTPNAKEDGANKENTHLGVATHHVNASMLSISKVNTNANTVSMHAHTNTYGMQIRDPTRYDAALLRLAVGLLVWDYRWYTLFSPLLLDTLANVVNDIGVTKIESEVRVWFDDIKGNRGIFDIVSLSINVIESWKRIELEK